MKAARAMGSAAAAIVLIALVGCVSESGLAEEQPHPSVVTSSPSAPAPPAPTSEPTPTADALVTFVSVVDGDTIETSAGTVRIIGIDTPERGECGHNEASMAIGRLLSPGDEVSLELPPGQNDTDRYGRLLRYVTTLTGIDLGLMQLEQGHAVARYDSVDGYPEHPHQTAYRAAQIASHGPGGSAVTVHCQVATVPGTPPATDDGWWRQYSSCATLKKNDAGHPIGPFDRDDPAQAEMYDWFAHGTGNRGDGDGDGLACE